MKNYVPPPTDVPFDGLEQVPSVTPFNGKGRLRRRWKDEAGLIYEWDYAHGRFEKYDTRGRHLGEFSLDGEQTKPANPKRKVQS